MTQENTMQFPFETTTKDGRKATVLAVMPDGRLAGYIEFGDSFPVWCWDADGSSSGMACSITLPLQIKPLTTYRMRNGGIAWTSGLVRGDWIKGMDAAGARWSWRIRDGRWGGTVEHPLDLIEELPPGTTA